MPSHVGYCMVGKVPCDRNAWCHLHTSACFHIHSAGIANTPHVACIHHHGSVLSALRLFKTKFALSPIVGSFLCSTPCYTLGLKGSKRMLIMIRETMNCVSQILTEDNSNDRNMSSVTYHQLTIHFLVTRLSLNSMDYSLAALR